MTDISAGCCLAGRQASRAQARRSTRAAAGRLPASSLLAGRLHARRPLVNGLIDGMLWADRLRGSRLRAYGLPVRWHFAQADGWLAG